MERNECIKCFRDIPGTGLEHSVGLDGGEGGNGILRIDPWF